MSESFEYTNLYEGLGSSLVDEVRYNANTKECAVDLNDQIYIYQNVHADAVDKLVTSKSVGEHYNKYFKTVYGPGKHVGHFEDMYYIKVAPVLKPEAIQSTIIGNTFNYDTITTTASSVNTNSKKHVVVYVLTSNPTIEREATTQAASVEQAVGTVEQSAKLLGLTIKVKRVVTYFV